MYDLKQRPLVLTVECLSTGGVALEVIRELVCEVQWNLSIKNTLNKGHLSNEDSVRSLNNIELCTNLPLN